LSELDETTLMDLHRFVSTHLRKIGPSLQSENMDQPSLPEDPSSCPEQGPSTSSWLPPPPPFVDIPNAAVLQWRELLDPLPFFEEQPAEFFSENTQEMIPLPQKRKELAQESARAHRDECLHPCKKMRNFSQDCMSMTTEPSCPIAEPADTMDEVFGPSHTLVQPIKTEGTLPASSSPTFFFFFLKE
jgi:hypothetical protein